MTDIKKMTKRQLLNEYKSACQQIEVLSYGVRDLMYRDQLEAEIARRGYEIRTEYSFA